MRMDCHKKAAEIDRLKNIELVSEILVDQQDMNASWNMTALQRNRGGTNPGR